MAQKNIEQLLNKIDSDEEMCNAETYEEIMSLSDYVHKVVEIYNEL